MGPIEARAPLTHGDLAPAAERLRDQEQVHDARSQVFGIVTSHAAGCKRQSGARLGQYLAAGLIETDLGTPRIVGPGVNVEHLLQLPDERGIGLRRNTPLLRQPRLEPVCFKVRRTVS